jgi:hypothetical protein
MTQMATQSPSRRQAAAKRAAATRKRNTAKRSATTTKSSARRTRTSASATTRGARRTTRLAARTAGRNVDAATTRLGAFGRQAQRALLIQVGAAATFGDKVRETARNYSTLNRVTRDLDRLERRGLRALNRGQRSVKRQRREFERDFRGVQRSAQHRVNGLRSDARGAVDQVKQLI